MIEITLPLETCKAADVPVIHIEGLPQEGAMIATSKEGHLVVLYKASDVKRILNRRRYRFPDTEEVAFEVRTELIDGTRFKCPDFEIRSAYTADGDYIGDPKTARLLCIKYGIRPEKKNAEINICTIGFSKTRGRWFGWSHRAIYGFKVGSTVKKGDCTASGGLRVGFKARTMDDVRKMAIAFADSVS